MRGTLVADAEFQIPAQGRYVALVRKAIRYMVIDAGFGESDRQDIEVAVGEAVTNAVCHRRPGHGTGSVTIRCRLLHDRLVLEIEDDGRASCPPFPISEPSPYDEHGRGWFLIHKLMDQVSVRCTNRGLLVRMVKRQRDESTAKMRRDNLAATL